MGGSEKVIALIVRSETFKGRASRDQLDMALAAASLGYKLELFFTSRGVFQLVAGSQVSDAGLPHGHKGWKALPGLTSVRAWAEPSTLSLIKSSGMELLLSLESCRSVDFSRRLGHFNQSLVI